MTLHELGEWGLIAALRDRFSDLPAGWIGIGDDTAVGTLTPGFKVLTTVDMLVEGLHFRREWGHAEDIGHKALAVNLSDVASMGGRPAWAVVGLSAPGDLEAQWVLDFYAGVAGLATQTGTRLVGGDTVGSTGPIAISVTVVGETPRPILRSGAKAGDVLFVTGPLGGSAAGLWCMENPGRVQALDRVYVKTSLEAHLRPTPHLTASEVLQGLDVRLAMLDNSDGLARSALLLAEANDLDIRLDVATFPIDPATRVVADLAGMNPVRWALFGGEDYNLVAAVAPEKWPAAERALTSAGVRAFRVGEVLDGHGRAWVREPDEQVHELTGVVGFEHF